jgi:RNA polymerase sigma factor (sigma-70 family)
VDSLDEIDSALDALKRAAPTDRKPYFDRLITAMYRRIENDAHLMLADYPRVKEQTGDLMFDVYKRLELAVNKPEVLDKMNGHKDCQGLWRLHLRWLLKDLARRIRPISPLQSDAASPHPSVVTLADRMDKRVRLLEAIEELDPELREVIDYVDFEKLTYVEVAKRLGVNESTIRRRHERAKQALAEVLGFE